MMYCLKHLNQEVAENSKRLSRTKQPKNYIELMYCAYMTYIAQTPFKNICSMDSFFQFVCFIYFVEIFMLIVINTPVLNRKSRYSKKELYKTRKLCTNVHYGIPPLTRKLRI